MESLQVSRIERQFRQARSGSAWSVLLRTVKYDQSIALLDPLEADNFFISHLPQLNLEGRIGEIVGLAKRLVPSVRWVLDLTPLSAKAVTRDLGMIVSSLGRHGLTLDAVPGLEDSLLALGTVTDEIPRDTLTTFALRNPLNGRMRTFTATTEERLFIQSVAHATALLPRCAWALANACDCSLQDEKYVELLHESTEQFSAMVRSTLEVKRGISPTIFSFQIQPYFPTVQIGGRDYVGPSGTQTLLLLIDLVLFGASVNGISTDPEFAEYVSYNAQYLPAVFRQVIEQAKHSCSLVDAAYNEVSSLQDASLATCRQAVLALESLQGMLDIVLKFRFPHRKLAQDNVQVRPIGSVGSGGYTIEALDKLTRLTLDAHSRVAGLRRKLNQ